MKTDLFHSHMRRQNDRILKDEQSDAVKSNTAYEPGMLGL